MSDLAQMVGKRVVGQQNIIPLIRDACDHGGVTATLDTEARRSTGVLIRTSSHPGGEMLTYRSRGRSYELYTRKVIAARLDDVPDAAQQEEEHNG